MHTRIAQLRTKIKNLADEARTIRHEENRALGRKPAQEVVVDDARCPQGAGHGLRFSWKRTGRKPDTVLYRDLRAHRRGTVRGAARAALLAYAMIRGMPYSKAEPGAISPPHWAEVRKLAERFGAVRDYSIEPYYDKVGDAAWNERKAAQGAAFDAWLAEAGAEISVPKSLTVPTGVAIVAP